MTTVSKHGEWQSRIGVDMLTSGSVRLGAGQVQGEDLYWTETRADLGGRTSIWRERDGERETITGEHDVRTMVHEYGGGAWAAEGGAVVFSTFPSHAVHAIVDGETRQLTDQEKLRYADFQVLPELGLVIAVREDHRESDLRPVNEVVALRLDGENTDGGQVLLTGAEFYMSPRRSPGGQLAWIEWEFPAMPWDATALKVAPAPVEGGRLVLGEPVQVAGSRSSAPCYPRWRGEELVYLDDPSGFWNFHTWTAEAGARPVHHAQHDFCPPPWVFGGAFTLLDDGRIVGARLIDGYDRLGVLHPDGTWEDAPTDAVVATPAGADGTRVMVQLAYADRPSTLEVWDLADDSFTELRASWVLDLPEGYISVAEPVTWEGPDGPVHAWYYPPTNPEFEAPEGELPPLKVLSHGGPTAQALAALRLDYQYWTSRGWALLDVNYGGSSGYGRQYRERLRGRWGIVDVRDCSDGALAMVEQGKADAARLAIEGGSAGGYTTLAALTSTDTFTAGNSLFGIADVALIGEESHKFESRYEWGLMGGSPQENPQAYRDRSPIFHLDGLSCPMLIQQGEEDCVVPPNQAVMMADAVREKNLPVALLMFAGEGHGWRRAETIRASLEAGLSFFGQIFGYTPPGVPVLPIENFPASSTPVHEE